MKSGTQEEFEKYLAVLLGRKNLTGESLAHANLQGVDFRGCAMEGIILDEADLSNANLEGCDLYWGFLCGANFTNANLSKAKLNGANLKGTNFSGANLCGTDFGKDNLDVMTDLSSANFSSSLYDATTIFPTNFDPSLNGMILKFVI